MLMSVRYWVIGIGCWMMVSCTDQPTPNNQRPTSITYQSPIDFDIQLAGNFGEPRPYHFHGGLDVKTENVEGKQVLAIADGYISRITVNLYGFGNAIYVNHPDGLTSVYCHLKKYDDDYEAKWCLNRRDTIDMHFKPDEYPVKAGDRIAWSGNTGHSTGPHLHLELHDTETWNLLDPMEKLAPLIADTVPPVAHSLMAIPMKGEGLFRGTANKQTIGIWSHRLEQDFTAWGRVGFALWADDYAQNTYHRYGIRHMQLLVDGREVFRSDVDHIPLSCHREVNLWGDYDHWLHTNNWYMKAFREPGMRLPILHTDFNQGIVTFDEERTYYLTFILRDYQNNQSRYDFTVRGQRDSRIKPCRHPQLLSRYLLFEQCLWPRVNINPQNHQTR